MAMSDPSAWIQELDQELDQAQAAGLLRTRRIRMGRGGPRMSLEGRDLVQFASNDYLGLSEHPAVLGAAKAALDAFGSGAGASRLVGGGSLAVHAELEEELAAFKGLPAALVYATGSMANLGLLSALAGESDLVVLDKACHATLYDGARLSGAHVLRFPHQNLAGLEVQLIKGQSRMAARGGLGAARAPRTLVVVEAVYSMDGDLAPLPELMALTARYNALLIVDEAHSTGVMGARGRGILEHFALAPPPNLILSGTLSKALASLGGYVAGPRTLIEYLVNRSRSFVYATALPPSCAAAALEAIRVLRRDDGPVQRLWEARRAMAAGLQALGWDLGPTQSPILPILVGPAEAALMLEERLWEAGFYVPAMRPPTVPAAACRLRLSVSAAHSFEQITDFLKALGERP
jgi:8-amino-7-oxononanoate synthase